jgi:hypothetical protein
VLEPGKKALSGSRVFLFYERIDQLVRQTIDFDNDQAFRLTVRDQGD